jgi:hypothetical protein
MNGPLPFRHPMSETPSPNRLAPPRRWRLFLWLALILLVLTVLGLLGLGNALRELDLS